MNRIESAANPLIRRIRALEQRKGREEAGAFFVEGIQAVWQAVDGGAKIETLVVAPDLLTSAAACAMVAGQRAMGAQVAEVSASLFERIAMRENPSGLAAIVRIISHDLASLIVTPESLFVALHEIGNPGNLGTILRTVDAVGGDGILLIGDGTDPYHPSAVRASVGTLFRIPVVRVSGIEEVFSWSSAHGVSVVTTSARATYEHWQAVYPSPLLMLFGNEGRGLPPDIVARGDLSVRIPMHGSASSLNLAVAAGVLLYEVLRQRQTNR
ncbi:MAG: RNA methyltransferase [Chloroflexota bacterium]|nr:RNA methyltransferase [Chloroflexota bacterium]